MHVMVVMMLRRGHGSRGGGRRSGFLRDGVAGEAERERRGRDKGLDHETTFLLLKTPSAGLLGHCR